MKKSPKIDFNKAKKKIKKEFYYMTQKRRYIQKIISPFLCKKNYKRMSSAIGYKHKIKQKTP